VDVCLPMEMRSVRPAEDTMDIDQLSSVIAVPPSAEPIVCSLHGHSFKCKFVRPGFELMFSMTFHKAQGLTMDAVIADLGKPIGGSVPRPSLFVAFSRVQTSRTLRRLGDVGLKFDSANMKWSKNLITFLSAMSFSIDKRPVDHMAPGIRLADTPVGGEPFAKRRGRPKDSSAKSSAASSSIPRQIISQQPPPGAAKPTVSIGNPYNLLKSSETLATEPLYSYFLCKGLVKYYTTHRDILKQNPVLFDSDEAILAAKRLRDFDHLVTRPAFSYDTVEDYYTDASCTNVIHSTSFRSQSMIENI